MRKYDLTVRTALMTVSDDDTTIHPLKTKVNVRINATLPMIVVDPSIVTDTIVNDPIVTTADTLNGLTCGLRDDVPETLEDGTANPDFIANRFVLVTKIQATVSKASNKIYYDRLCKDLIIIPDISLFNSFSTDGKVIDISGYRVGSLNQSEITTFKPHLPVNNESRFELPVGKNKISNVVSYNLIPGIFMRHGNKDIQIEQQLQYGFNHYRTEGTPIVMVNLGKVTNLFDTSAEQQLPLQMIYQESPGHFSVFGLGVSKTNNYDLYIMLQI